MRSHVSFYLLVLLLVAGLAGHQEAFAAKKRRRAKKYYPPLTHPVVLWSRTLSGSQDAAERKKAAFKLSAYTQPIFQVEVVNALLACTKDPDVELRVLCTKALGRAGKSGQAETVRKELIQLFQTDPTLRETIVRTFITRKDASPDVHDTLLASCTSTTNQEELLVLLGYFESFGSGNDKFVTALSDVYNTVDNQKVKRSAIKALGERSKGQDAVVEVLAKCAESKETPLALTCLSGLEVQAIKDKRAWSAVEKTILSDDPDVLDATLDVINALPENRHPQITTRLLTILEEFEDPQLLEKTVLALGVCGDHSEPVVAQLQKFVEQKETDDGTRVASALVLGKQTDQNSDRSKEILTNCLKAGAHSASLKTACQLGIKELEARKLASTKK